MYRKTHGVVPATCWLCAQTVETVEHFINEGTVVENEKKTHRGGKGQGGRGAEARGEN